MGIINRFNDLAIWLRSLITLLLMILILWIFLVWLIIPPFTNMQKDRAALKKVEAQITRLQSPLNNSRAIFSNQLVSAIHTAGLMKILLQKNPKLELIRFKKLPVNKVGSLFEHGFELVLQGTYRATLNYLKLLQEAGQPLYWRKLDYKVTAYPVATISLQLSSLSRQAHWFEVKAVKEKVVAKKPRRKSIPVKQDSIPAKKGT